MMTGRNDLSYERLFRLNPLLRCLGGVLLMASFSTLAREYRFSPSSLEGDMLAQQDIDLSLFSKSNAQLPGTYSSRVQVNERRLSTTNIAYVSSPEGSLIPQLTPDMLRAWGLLSTSIPPCLRYPPIRLCPKISATISPGLRAA
jgi:outer membrane usher protein